MSEERTPDEFDESLQAGQRWLNLQLLGEIDAFGKFNRGVGSYPGLDDPVHFPAAQLLSVIHAKPDTEHIALGRLSASPNVVVGLNVQRLVTRHSVVVGSTGSGKTSAVATILQRLARTDWPAANIVVIDPHGEYVSALGDVASVRSVTPGENAPLHVPYWALPASDILATLTGAASQSATLSNRFSELVAQERRAYADRCEWLSNSDDVNADTPIPFDLHEVWHQLDYENSLVVSKKPDIDPRILTAGNAASLLSTKFEPYGTGSIPPFQGPMYGRFLSAPDNIRARMKDPRFAFFLKPDAENLTKDPFVDVLGEWLGGDKPISVLDFSGLPSEAADLAIGVVLQLLFELSLRSTSADGVGRHRPVLVVMEEAHRFLGESSTVRVAKQSVNRIAREGRKYGIGIMLVSQRPAELPDTALSQAGTIVALRLTNTADQSHVRAGLPDVISGLAESLSSLRTGEAVVTGEAFGLPSRVLIDRPIPSPKAADPDLKGWKGQPTANDVSTALSKWRGIVSLTNKGQNA